LNQTNPPSIAAPTFLVGSERSGTTLLRLMLDHHPEIAFDKEFDYVVAMVSDRGELPTTAAFAHWVATVRGMDYAVDPSLGYSELVNGFLRQKQAASGGKPHVGATIHRHFDRLRYLWPDARYVHLVRDPRDVARSVVQKGWAGNVYHASEFWLDAERCWDALQPGLAGGQAIEVRYENLIEEPEAVLTSICRFLGVEYSREMLGYPADAPQYPPPDPALVGLWKRALGPSDVSLVEFRTGRLLGARGYAPSGYPRARVGHARHQLLLADARLRLLRARVSTFGVRLVAKELVARRLRLRGPARRAQLEINAIEQRMVDQESAGIRAPSANIRPGGHGQTSRRGRPGG
jgi:hypothetical protein